MKLGLSRRHHYRYPQVEMGRGREAGTPSEIPKKGWKDILWRLWEEQSEDNIGMIAAGVAYYALLALFPAVAAMVSLYGLVADPASIEGQLEQLAGFLPGEALQIVRDQAHSVASAPSEGLGFGVAFGLLLTLWSASRGVNSLITALNVAYDEEEKRSFFKLAFLSLTLTIGALVFIIFTLAMVVAVPALLNILPLGPMAWVVAQVRWPILGAAIMFVLAVLYRYGPSRRKPQWRWVSWGAVAATVLWLLGSIGFSIYVSNFGSYNETYGSVGAVVVLLLWLNLTSYAIILGAELNAEMEHQTARDTTDSGGRPLGQRGALVADTVGERKSA